MHLRFSCCHITIASRVSCCMVVIFLCLWLWFDMQMHGYLNKGWWCDDVYSYVLKVPMKRQTSALIGSRILRHNIKITLKKTKNTEHLRVDSQAVRVRPESVSLNLFFNDLHRLLSSYLPTHTLGHLLATLVCSSNWNVQMLYARN